MITTKNGVVVKNDEIKKATLTCSPVFAKLFNNRICNKCHKPSNSWYLDMATGLIYCDNCNKTETL
jgi:late competence protein required for DNA uptake (superfamily II DNA/RNA helicase)